MGRTAKAALHKGRTRWEANCLFCGEGLEDEGAAFLDHVAFNRDCRSAFANWQEQLSHDWLGG